MSNKSTAFELYRYQLLPIDRYLQGNLLTGVGSVEELISRKNEFFSEAIKGTKNFSDKRHETITKKQYEEDDFFLLRIALINAISSQLAHHHLRAIHEPLFEKQHFWSLLHQYEGKIKSVEFEIITPNMANISGSLSDDLKDFAKATNSTRNKLKLESDPEAPLHLEENNSTLQGLVNYSSEGGGNISLKIDGIKKTYNTSKTVKEVQLGDMEIQGSAQEVASVIKELLK